MRGDTGPGVAVRIFAESRRVKIVSGNELVGDWELPNIGIHALNEGFRIKAEGEEFILTTEDDVALAEEIGIAAASPRLARRIATRHNSAERPVFVEEKIEVPSNLRALGFAVAGALVVLGGTFLNLLSGDSGETAALSDAGQGSGVEFWLAFVIGGVLMIAVAYVMAIGTKGARLIATVVLIGMIVVFGLSVGDARGGATQLTAYGFIAGGLVVAVAVLFSGSLEERD